MADAIPHGAGAASMRAAIAAFKAAIGAENVFAGEDSRVDAYNDSYPIEQSAAHAPGAVLTPDGVDEIRAILKIANHYRVPIWTVSVGRNLAYGGAAPAMPGATVVDLSRMNRIIEVNADSAYCIVEPGVTFFQLYEYLQLHKIDLWISPPEPGWGSVMGNALERGVGYTPYGDNYGFSCGMEVVLADGDLLRTGMGAVQGGNAWPLFKYGFGPVVDGLFTQSNLGVVTKLGMWLMPAPPAYRSYMICFPRESDLGAIIEIMRPLRINQIIQNCAMLTPWTYEATLSGARTKYWQGGGRVPDDKMPGIVDRMGIGFWNLYAAQYGTPGIMDEQWRIIQSAFAHIPGTTFHFADERPELVGAQLRNLLGKGVPNMTTFDVLNWIPNAGHTDFSPVSPSTGAAATALYQIMKTEMHAQGFDYIGAFIIGWREMHNVALIIFDKSNPVEQAKVRQMFPRLVRAAAARGFTEYRTHVSFMDEVAASYDFNDHAMLRFSERLKDALDPNGILAPGKSGIWPAHQRRS